MKLSKPLKLIINYVAGPVLFVLIGISIYQQVQSQKNLPMQLAAIQNSMHGSRWWMLPAGLILMLFNWGIESLKWQRLASHVGPISFWQSLRSVTAGVAFTMLTPNRMGEFMGRALYFPDGSRVRAATLTLVGSLSQLIITFLAGMAGLFYLKPFIFNQFTGNIEYSAFLFRTLLYGTAVLMLIGLVLYFNIHWLIRAVEKIPSVSKYAFFIHLIGELKPLELIKILGWSALRYLVFLAQYALFFRFFAVEAQLIHLISATAVLFLLLAAVPTIALAELGIRGTVSILVLKMFTQNILGILMATAGIWLINIIFPAIAGSLLLLSVKLFKRDNRGEGDAKLNKVP